MHTFFVYIIYSPSRHVYYKGYSTDPFRRLREHNENRSHYTSGKGPWQIVYVKDYPTKKEALVAEKKLKKAGTDYLQKLIREYKTTRD